MGWDGRGWEAMGGSVQFSPCFYLVRGIICVYFGVWYGLAGDLVDGLVSRGLCARGITVCLEEASAFTPQLHAVFSVVCFCR